MGKHNGRKAEHPGIEKKKHNVPVPTPGSSQLGINYKAIYTKECFVDIEMTPTQLATKGLSCFHLWMKVSPIR
jgi:hypothetical protein